MKISFEICVLRIFIQNYNIHTSMRVYTRFYDNRGIYENNYKHTILESTHHTHIVSSNTKIKP